MSQLAPVTIQTH